MGMRVDIKLTGDSERTPSVSELRVTELITRFFAATARKNPARARFYVDLADPLKGQREIQMLRIRKASVDSRTSSTSDKNKGTKHEQK
jgi:hypothetical protein